MAAHGVLSDMACMESHGHSEPSVVYIARTTMLDDGACEEFRPVPTFFSLALLFLEGREEVGS